MRMKAGIPVLIMIATLSDSALTAEYSVTPFATLRGEASTNKRLTTQNSETVYGGIIDIGALFAAETEASSFSLTPSFSLSRFSDDGNNVDQDRENYFINSNGSHRLNERVTLGAFVNYANTGVIGTELDELGLVVDTPTNFSRKTLSAGPSITYAFSERDSLSLGASFTDVTYDNNDTGLTDYDRYSISASWNRQLTEKGLLIVSVFTSKQESELSTLERNSAGPSPELLMDENKQTGVTVGYIHSFSETLLGRFSIGVRDTETEFPFLSDFDYRLSPASAAASGRTEINSNDPALALFLAIDPTFLNDSLRVNRVYTQGSANNTGLLLDTSVEKQFEVTRVTAGVSRSSQGTGLGFNQERDEFFLTADRELSDRLNGNTGFRYFSTTLEDGQTNNSIDQIRLEAGLNYSLTEFWTLGGGYGYRQISPDNGDSRDDHAVFFTVGYNGNKYAISR